MNFLMLPDELVLECLARVSRLYYPILSQVSKRFSFLLSSRDLSQTRTRIGHIESCIYVCLREGPYSKLFRWFILCSKKGLVPISSYSASLPGVAAVGPNIYAIGGGSEKNPSSRVMVMDSGCHKWREAPSMRIARVSPSNCTLDGKIYVIGGCSNLDSTNWMEIFDTKTQTWEFLQIPSEEICGGSKYRSITFEGTIYVKNIDKDVTYKLHRGRWRKSDIALNKWYTIGKSCVIENVFYRYIDRQICWYDPEQRFWRLLKISEGFSSLPISDYNHVYMADHGGKMAIMCEVYEQVDKKITIWYGEIALEKHPNREISGTIEGFDKVFVSSNCPHSGFLVHALTCTVW